DDVVVVHRADADLALLEHVLVPADDEAAATQVEPGGPIAGPGDLGGRDEVGELLRLDWGHLSPSYAICLGLSEGGAIIKIRFCVEEDFHGQRLDHYLKRKIRRLSRTRIQEVIRTQLVGPGGRKMKPSSPVATGDELVIRRTARPEPPAPTH